VRGKVDTRGAGGGSGEDEAERTEAPKVIADDVMAFDDPEHEAWVRNQIVHLDVPAEIGAEQLARLEEVLAGCPGPDKVVLHLQREDGIVDMELGDRFKVQGGGPSGEKAQRAINALFGRPVWRVEVLRKKAPERQPNGRQRALTPSSV
jgi:hypothetical protein